jgi:site-specific recombinase XerD
MSVILRQRLKVNKISLYLDIYTDNVRKYEYLKLYLFKEPSPGKLSPEHKEHNRKTLIIAENKRSIKEMEILQCIPGASPREKPVNNFLEFFKDICTKKTQIKGENNNYNSAYFHLSNFAGKDNLMFNSAGTWFDDFKNYLTCNINTGKNNTLQKSSQAAYFNLVKSALKKAYYAGHCSKDFSQLAQAIKSNSKPREYLTKEEIQKLINTPCGYTSIKKSFLFSCLTGLRLSDIQNLKWKNLIDVPGSGYILNFQQKKTEAFENLPINKDAIKLVYPRCAPDENIFRNFTYNAWFNIRLQQWLLSAGITKKITFHCARHTFASLQLANGTDIYTVSKLLGHKDIKTTQIYSKVSEDAMKKATANMTTFNI